MPHQDSQRDRLQERGRLVAVLRLIDRMSALLAIGAAAALLILAATVIVDVAGRSFFNRPLTGALEMTAYWWMPMLVLLAFAYTECRQEHIKVTILLDTLPPRMRRVVEGCFGVVATGLLIALAWHAWGEALDSAAVGQTTASSPPVAVWPFKFLAPLGVGMLALQVAATTVRHFLGLVPEHHAFDNDADVA